MIAALRRHLADPALPARLRTLAADAPAAAPLSLTLDLGPTAADWLAALPATGPFWYQARPAAGLYRLVAGRSQRTALGLLGCASVPLVLRRQLAAVVRGGGLRKSGHELLLHRV